MILRILLLCFVLLIIELYAFQALRTLIKMKWVLFSYQIISLLLLVFIIYSFMQFDRSVGQTKMTMFTMGLVLLVYVPKMVLTLVLLGEDVFRIGAGSVNYFIEKNDNVTFFASRRKFVSQIGLGLAAVPFLSLIYGVTVGKYNYKVIKQRIFFPDLPDAFDGFTITQISDVHSGSFDNPDKINYAIDLVNEQNSDMILFTGDIVNTDAKEMHPWIETFNRIKKHEYGKYSVLGNHDYGEYITWPTEKDKEDNFQAIKNLYGQIDFKLLLNEHTFIEKGDAKIALIGVENWGHNFKKAGDINKASQHVKKEDFKILMSHDPSHWEHEVQHHDKHFHLTLSGHTHGMQFGIEIPGYFKWSLAQYVYKQWAGLYENVGRYVYVNRGFGFHAYPGRVGIMPEITVIELKKGKDVA
ncbi:metallophosphoesterase [Flavobacterium gawalongense]|uniref:Metallophosphoesterase n=1 Tax=Flavobacterium gawalongense TaxID=2594432 RepID=A0A553BX67_9FLAO|nr:metallophosphoesterase [Flavobacterium gawalongense]TRX04182.1 metallophosphoesterase [Flavobacterium gawalongense]TRX09368.1 metallophosphoesterase [Flavobacterium gawalongense]TRX12818.1 metallophosphoesterase [Flavobacterium gawalongense]TRX13163.1 metallophosphoesterase [Flavobacterium gawalongense]TRX30775.1 metallophosphoesterase [Flavobacterium gawalongense]